MILLLRAPAAHLSSTTNPTFPTRVIVTSSDNTTRILSSSKGRQINVQILSPKLEVMSASYSGITSTKKKKCTCKLKKKLKGIFCIAIKLFDQFSILQLCRQDVHDNIENGGDTREQRKNYAHDVKVIIPFIPPVKKSNFIK